MNYYEHHLGDYEGATAHLSWAEDCAYRRLICLYYRSEAPIPPDIKQVCRLVRAASKPERDAVQQVLTEFFDLLEDGWHQARCDADIARFKDKRRKAKASADARWSHAERDADDMRTHTERNANAYRTHTERNANGMHRAPVPSPQSPVPSPTEAKLPRGGRGSRLPADWEPEPEHLAFAESVGLRNGKAASELAKFRDYWAAQPGQKGVKADWSATWRNWCRKASDFAGSDPSAAPDFEACV